MPYFDPAGFPSGYPVPLQVRDRLRDLLDQDTDIRALYPEPAEVFALAAPGIAPSEPRLAVSWDNAGFDTVPADPLIRLHFIITFQLFRGTRPGDTKDKELLDTATVLTWKIFEKLAGPWQRDPNIAYPAGVTRPPCLWNAVSFPIEDALYVGMRPGEAGECQGRLQFYLHHFGRY